MKKEGGEEKKESIPPIFFPSFDSAEMEQSRPLSTGGIRVASPASTSHAAMAML